MFSALGGLHFVGITLALGSVWIVPDVWPGAFAWSWSPFIPGLPPQPLGLSHGTLLMGLFALALCSWMAIRRDHPIEKGFFWTALAVLLALASGTDPVASSVHLVAGALVLTLAVVETSYAMAFHDDLTRLPARRALWREIEAAGRSYTLAMVDIDHFKTFNDRHGHDVGDQVLRLVAAQLRKVAGGGRAFRYGGEEFTVVFPGKGRDDAWPHLERLRQTIEESRFAVRRAGRPRKQPAVRKPRKRPPRRLSVTVSIGVAERTEKAATGEAVLKAADRALYRAKKGGRNRVAK